MAIPGYQSFMLPLLQLSGDKKEHRTRESAAILADRFGLSDQEKTAKLPSGNNVIHNRVGWAATYLKKCNLLESTKRGYFQITERGLKILNEKPEIIDNKYLERFSEYQEFRNTRKSNKIEQSDVIADNTPEEILELAHDEIIQDLAQELLSTVKECSPNFFELLVIDLLVKMGYGGSRRDAGQAIGKSGDEGIDGIIKEDKLGLDVIYIQAKRWENVVSRPEIQKFAGALQGQRAKKGIFITTSYFSKEAEEYASKIDSKIVLIDGQKLGQLMIENNIGVSTTATYEVKKIDIDYFEE